MKDNSKTAPERKPTIDEWHKEQDRLAAIRAERVIPQTADFDKIDSYATDVVEENLQRWQLELRTARGGTSHGLKSLSVKHKRRLEVLVAECKAILKQRKKPQFVDIAALRAECEGGSVECEVQHDETVDDGAQHDETQGGELARGPWVAVDVSSETTAIPSYELRDEAGTVVAVCDPLGALSMDADFKNARLLAAAPMLYRALVAAWPLVVPLTPEQERVHAGIEELLQDLQDSQKGGFDA